MQPRLRHLLAVGILGLAQGVVAQAQTAYDSVIGDALTLPQPTDRWFTVAGREIAYIIDGDSGDVKGTLTLSRFSPALESHVDAGRIYSYGSFYTRNVYGERTDVVQIFDLETARPVSEIEIPPKSAGIGHAGMIGLIGNRYVGVWNITPAMSVSIVDTTDQRFVGEISTPGCAGVYPIDAGFLMACGDGRLQYVRLDSAGAEVERSRSDVFFSVSEDPVFDYAVATADGWMFMSLEGQVFEASVEDGSITVSEPWSINPTDVEDAVDLNGVAIEPDDHWRVGGDQPFAYHAASQLLVTLMHEGGGQETFEDPGTQIWVFDTLTRRRSFVIDLGEDVSGAAVQLIGETDPMLVVASTSPSGSDLLIHHARSGRLQHRITEISADHIQRLD